MSFLTFSEAPFDALLADARAASTLTVMLGAGASIEAGLPSWPKLIERLLTRTVNEQGLLNGAANEVEQWVDEAIRRDGYLGAAAIVEALVGEETLDRWIPEELYGRDKAAEDYLPGPICKELPNLAASFGSGFRLMTTNYDDLAERALCDDDDHACQAIPYVGEHRSIPAGGIKVVHLHGYAGADGRLGSLVLSETDYQRMQQATPWQEAQVRTALDDGMFVFVGASLSDPNLIRYLYSGSTGTATPPRYAIFVRQDAYAKEVPTPVRAAREKAVRARWEMLGVTVVFVDYYMEVAQLVYEMAEAKRKQSDYVPLSDRAADWVGTVNEQLLGLDSDDAFVAGQELLTEHLLSALDRATAAVEELESRRWDEKLALTVWLTDGEGRNLVNRATTDRLHLDRATVDPVAIDEHARWVAVRSYCRGQPLAEPRDVYASRWHFIRGTPLVVESERHGRIPVGCLTTASMQSQDETMLNEMEDVVEARFNQALTTTTLNLLTQPFQ